MAKKLNLNKQVSVIPKGKSEGAPVYIQGARVRFLGLPTVKGAMAMNGTSLTFEGSFDGWTFFTVNNRAGLPLTVPAKAAQLVLGDYSNDEGMVSTPAILPIDGELFEGIQMVRPRSNQDELEDRKLEFYAES